jgi:hypothetical protein
VEKIVFGFPIVYSNSKLTKIKRGNNNFFNNNYNNINVKRKEKVKCV